MQRKRFTRRPASPSPPPARLTNSVRHLCARVLLKQLGMQRARAGASAAACLSWPAFRVACKASAPAPPLRRTKQPSRQRDASHAAARDGAACRARDAPEAARIRRATVRRSQPGKRERRHHGGQHDHAAQQIAAQAGWLKGAHAAQRRGDDGADATPSNTTAAPARAAAFLAPALPLLTRPPLCWAHSETRPKRAGSGAGTVRAKGEPRFFGQLAVTTRAPAAYQHSARLSLRVQWASAAAAFAMEAEAAAGPSGAPEPAVEEPRSEAEQRWWFSTEGDEEEEEEEEEEAGPAAGATACRSRCVAHAS